ncbi:hypothetical protein GCM10017691_60880 [Pseudonocardia petroleophila]|uniref:MarR family transcriptional regulator n=1 Tax=Pseudonocardia petroleophila TaxID=37331 RepID=A0A7G7MMB8_9PSEU|nr:MarR family transcriptional regulator [Pseudonocardia petroleophila]QNG53929.1 MarR family transcriptional regulator [Pseudonocardia petroleophila]
MPDLRRLFDDLVRVEILLWEAVDRRLRDELDLPLGRVEVLRVVATTDPCRIADVVSAVGISVGAASKLVDRLEAAQLCVRRPHPGDRRSSLLIVTRTGRQVHERAERVVSEELATRLDDLTAYSQRQLAISLRGVREHLSG